MTSCSTHWRTAAIIESLSKTWGLLYQRNALAKDDHPNSLIYKTRHTSHEHTGELALHVA